MTGEERSSHNLLYESPLTHTSEVNHGLAQPDMQTRISDCFRSMVRKQGNAYSLRVTSWKEFHQERRLHLFTVLLAVLIDQLCILLDQQCIKSKCRTRGQFQGGNKMCSMWFGFHRRQTNVTHIHVQHLVDYERPNTTDISYHLRCNTQ